MRRQILSTMYNNRKGPTEKSGTTVFLCMLHVLLLPVVKPMYSIAFRTGIQVYRFFCFGDGIVSHKFRLPVGLFG